MKTIKEMSEEYLEEEKDEIVCVYDRYAGFVDGASAVIRKIQEAFNIRGIETMVDQINSFIEELKEK